MTVTLLCTGRDTHVPVVVYACDVPLPDGWRESMPSSVFELYCDRSRGGCGRSPRPGDERLRVLIEAVAATPSGTFDISYWNL